MKSHYDIIIAGNGVLAYSLAFALMQKDPRLKLALVGPSKRPGGASIAAGAMLNSFAELEKGTLDTEPARIKFRMNRAAAKMWPEWVESINQASGGLPLSIMEGTYVIHNSRINEMDDENFAAILDALRQHDEPFQDIDPREIRGLRPTTQGRAHRAIYIPGEGAIQPTALLAALERSFAAANVEIFDDTATHLTVRDAGIKELRTAQERVLTAPHIVLACGAHAQGLIDQIPDVARRVPRLFYGTGIAMVLRTRGQAPERVIRSPNRGMACGIHVVPYDKDVCYVGATNVISPVPELNPTMTGLFGLMEAAMEQINEGYYNAKLERWIVGHRPTALDNFPLIGETSVKGLWILSGTRREGIHVSPLLARQLSAEILGQPPLVEHPFTPERPLIRVMTREEGIRGAVAHLKSSAYQHGLHVPNNGWCDFIDDMLRSQVEQIYNGCGIHDYGVPPEMLGMYRLGLIRPEAHNVTQSGT